MKRLITSFLIYVCTMMSVSAQDDDMQLQFEIETVKCYRECIVSGMETARNVWEMYKSDDSIYFCMASQERAFGLIGCRQSCRDLEELREQQVPMKSKAHLAFMIKRILEPMKVVGLWDGLSNSPTLGNEPDEFMDSCARYVGIIRNSACGVSDRVRDGLQMCL